MITTLDLPRPLEVDCGNLDRAALADLWQALETAKGRNTLRLAFVEGGEDPDAAVRAVKAMRAAVRQALCQRDAERLH